MNPVESTAALRPAPRPARPVRHVRARLAVPAVVALLALAGCASTATPVVYQPRPSPTSAASVSADLASCRREAAAAVGVNGVQAARLGTETGRAGLREFADKAVESLVVGSRNAWERARGAAAGEMAGGLTAMLLNWNEPDRVHREYVDLCLKQRGHTVLGWR